MATLPVNSWTVEALSNQAIDETSASKRYGGLYQNVFSFEVRIKQARVSTIENKVESPTKIENTIYRLDMRVPPQEITLNYNQEINRDKVRGGWKVSIWGQQMITIEASGSTGLFFLANEGVTRYNAAYSFAHTELQQLLQIYRNNGMSYDPKYGVIDTVGEVILFYDGHEYRGSFDSFEVTEDAANPFNMRYSFTFTARGDSTTRVFGHYRAPEPDNLDAALENAAGVLSDATNKTPPKEEISGLTDSQRSFLKFGNTFSSALSAIPPYSEYLTPAVETRDGVEVSDIGSDQINALNARRNNQLALGTIRALASQLRGGDPPSGDTIERVEGAGQ